MKGESPTIQTGALGFINVFLLIVEDKGDIP
jgi:hypothetical protein